MLGWLASKGQNSRVYMCIKEVKWELETADAVKRATVLAVAQFLRDEALSAAEISMDVLDRPLDYRRDDLMGFYEQLETIRNHNGVQIEAIKRNMRRLGILRSTVQ